LTIVDCEKKEGRLGLELESMAIQMPEVGAHPNRVAFRGVLTFVEVASDAAPAGARGHRVMLKKSATEKALPTLLGMALDYTPALDKHDARRKVGVITEADIVEKAGASPGSNARGRPFPHVAASALSIGGFLYARDFPELVREMRAKGPAVLGMSYEIAEAKIEDLGADVWEVSDFTFTGAAVLRRDKAAYRETWIELQ
jgi:hypothetical protein